MTRLTLAVFGFPLRNMRLATIVLAATAFVDLRPATAFSEIIREDVPPSEEGGGSEIRREVLPPPPGIGPTAPERSAEPGAGDQDEPETEADSDAEEQPPRVDSPSTGMPVPLPDPIVIPRDPAPAAPEKAVNPDADVPVPEVQYDVEALPEPVRRIRDLIMEACLSGEIERLRPLITTGQEGTQLSFGGNPDDPIQFLKGLSGDDEGQEILAILYEVLDAGYVHTDVGQPGEMYVWPYFFAVPLAELNPRQRVELFKLVTAGDYEDMKNFGAYIFYRVGISPEGQWVFFVAGD